MAEWASPGDNYCEEGIDLGLSNFNVHTNHLGILLKGKMLTQKVSGESLSSAFLINSR